MLNNPLSTLNITTGNYDVSADNFDYTYVHSRYMCITWVYSLHMAFAYSIDVIGILAMISRVVPQLTKYHSLFGRLYIMAMLWCTACSLLIHNLGLPFSTIVNILYVLVSITIGHLVIWKHSNDFEATINNQVEIRINELKSDINSDKQISLSQLKAEEKNKLENEKTFTTTFFSVKYLHGILMAFSWSQIFGRTISTNPGLWKKCWTYPVFKSNKQLIGSVDPDYFGGMSDTTFLTIITVPTVSIILVVAIMYAAIESYIAKKEKAKKENSCAGENEDQQPQKIQTDLKVNNMSNNEVISHHVK